MNNEELELRREVSRAEAARAYIEDPILVGAFEALEARFLMAWRATQPTDTAGREQLWHHIQALAEVRQELQHVLDDGLLALERLDDLRNGITNP